MGRHYPNLNPEKALIWRIVHWDNLPWLLDNGLHCGHSSVKSSQWINIGNEELIDRRGHRRVPITPGGNLNDYVLCTRQFFTKPCSIWAGRKEL
ncbi:DUF4433 domain-containing protein, partial [Endozoicomonas sp.]|nr:DUF4433 domain-containing protein [Endozoicomonas sp.]